MTTSAIRPYAIASAALVGVGMIGATLASGPEPTRVETRAVHLTSGDPAADLPTDVYVDIQQTVSVGETELNSASADFAGGNIFEGMNNELAGVDTLLLGTQDDLVVEGYAYLTGAPDTSHFAFLPLEFPPTDFAAGAADAQQLLADAQTELTAAFTAFASNQVLDGLSYVTEATNAAFGLAPDDLILGLTGSLLAP